MPRKSPQLDSTRIRSLVIAGEMVVDAPQLQCRGEHRRPGVARAGADARADRLLVPPGPLQQLDPVELEPVLKRPRGQALRLDPAGDLVLAHLEQLRGFAQDSGEGRWTVQAAVDHAVPLPVITAALFARFYSRGNGDYAARVLAALRNQFGGHAVKSAQKS